MLTSLEHLKHKVLLNAHVSLTYKTQTPTLWKLHWMSQFETSA